MKRNLVRLGNKSYTITIPKPWVIKNNLKPRSEIEITESGPTLILSSSEQPIDEIFKRIIFSEDESIDEVISEITDFYRNGYTDIKIVIIKYDQQIIDDLLRYLSNFHGIAITVLENSIIIKSSEGQQKRFEMLQKCFQNVLVLGELIKTNPLEPGFKKQVEECYRRIFFLSEYVFRLIAMQGGSDFKQTLNQYAMAWTLQCMGEILKRTAEFEHENARVKKISSAAIDIHALIRNMYNVCVLKKTASEFYSIQSGMIEKIKLKKYDATLCEHCLMYQYLCLNLVRQEIAKNTSTSLQTNLNL